MFRSSCCVALLGLVCAGAATARAAEPAPAAGAAANYERVHVEPAKTSIYVGSATLTMPAFERKGGRYVAPYAAKLFPYFFWNEEGRLSVDISDEMLRQLARGETVEFKGRAVRDDGTERHVEGRATPADAASGKLKVRVFVTKKLELIFNTTYRFGKQGSAGDGGAR